MYSFPNLEPVCYFMSISKCCFLTCIQVSQEADEVVWYSYLLENFPQFVVIHTVRGFNVDDEADVFLEFPCFFYDPMGVGNVISVSSVFSKSSLNNCPVATAEFPKIAGIISAALSQHHLSGFKMA